MFVFKRERERERERAFFGPKFRELFERESRYESKVFIGFPLALFYFYFFKAEYFFYLFNIFLV